MTTLKTSWAYEYQGIQCQALVTCLQ
uniref:Uncharacterized protein n=1 Tax=Rhizophora mucronata TaxID=61149 RepID=A0A2P2NX12_RHIMU